MTQAELNPKPQKRRAQGFDASLLTKEPPPSVDGAAGIKTRLLWARLRTGKALRDVAPDSGMTISMLSRLERGDAIMTVAAVEALAKLFGVRRDWLAFGQGSHELTERTVS